MATEIYLGNPPQYVIDWIKAHSKPVANPKTKITFTNGTSQEYDWSGEIGIWTIRESGLIDDDSGSWIKKPQTVEIGTNVTSVGNCFYNCGELTSVTIPDSVTSIGDYAFSDCSELTSVTIGKGVTSIGNFAFSNCIRLKSIIVKGRTTTEARNLLANAGLKDINIVQGEN